MARKKETEAVESEPCGHDSVSILYSAHKMNKTKLGMRAAFIVCEKCGEKIPVSSPVGFTVGLKETDAENS